MKTNRVSMCLLGCPLMFLLLFQNCSTSNYLYPLDGTPNGRAVQKGMSYVSIGAFREYDVVWDTLNHPQDVTVSNEIAAAPVAGIDMSIGVTPHIDIGGGLSVGLINVSGRFFSQISLWDTNSVFGVALAPMLSFSGSPETFLGLELDTKYNQVGQHLLLPISYELTPHLRVSLIPMLGREKFSVQDMEDFGDNHEVSTGWLDVQGLSFGVKIGGSQGGIYPQVSLISYDHGKSWLPFVGVAIGGKQSEKPFKRAHKP